MATATITFDASDYGGVDFDPRRAKVYATNNAEDQTIYDTAGNKQYIGSGTGTISSDGTGSISVPIPAAGFQPATWQTTIHFDVPDRNAPNGRRKVSAGPFTITTSGTLGSKIEEMPILPVYAGRFLDLVQGYLDHGNVSGALTIDPTIGHHDFDATGPTVVTISGSTNGPVVSLCAVTGADDVTIANVSDDVTLTDDAVATFIHRRGAWRFAGGGSGSSGPADTTPPSAVTDLVATGGEAQIVLDWSAATDADSSVAYRYRVWLTSGGASGSWTSTSSTGATISDLDDGTYTAEVYAYSGGGASATDTAAATVTAPVVPYDEAVLDDNPTYYWPLDDAPGTTSPRQIGSHVGAITYGLSGVTFGGTTLGGAGTAANFDGTGTGIAVNVGPASGLDEFTFEAIVRSAGSGGIFGHPTGYYPSSHKSGSQVTAVVMGQVINGTGAPTEFHLAIRSTPQISGNPLIEIFINGANVGNALGNSPVLAAYTAMRMGRDEYSTSALNGRMSDFAVYEGTALSDARILAHAQAAGKA